MRPAGGRGRARECGVPVGDAMTERAARQYHFNTPFVDGATWQDALRNHFRKIRRGSDALVAYYDLALVIFARDQARDISAGKLGHIQNNILALGWIFRRL